MSQLSNIDVDELMERLACAESSDAQRVLTQEHADLCNRDLVMRIADAATQAARKNISHAHRLASTAAWVADLINDDYCRGRAARATANVLLQSGQYDEADKEYARALSHFEALGEDAETGRTLTTSLQALIYLGRYTEAHARAARAREILTRGGDQLLLARLDTALGNVLHRQDRFEEALLIYRRAERKLEELGAHRDHAVVLLNIAVSSISTHNYAAAEDAYRTARELCSQYDMPLLAAQADYNIAYLHYYRGEYARAIELYQATSEYCAQVGDVQHAALCDLDRAEMYLDLRFASDASKLAQSAFTHFEALNLGYEAAKALVFLGIAAWQQGEPFRALEYFSSASDRFAREQNRAWPAVLALYSAIVLYREGRYFEARRSCVAAYEFLSHSSLKHKACVAGLLRSLLDLHLRERLNARFHCEAALRNVGPALTPALDATARYILAMVDESDGNLESAFESLRGALDALWRSSCIHNADELKIPILDFEKLIPKAFVAISAEFTSCESSASGAFEAIERAKLRDVVELIAFRAQSLPPSPQTRSSLVHQLHTLRRELNWYYRQTDALEMRDEQSTEESAQKLQMQIQSRESEYASVLRDWSPADADFLSLQTGQPEQLEGIRRALPVEAAFLQYFRARTGFHAVVLDRDSAQSIPLCGISRAQELIYDLRQEFARCSSKSPSEAASHLLSTQSVLQSIYKELFEPVRAACRHSQLIISPHSFLFGVPFHCLFDGERYLCDEFTFSYALSGSTYAWSAARTQPSTGKSVACVRGGLEADPESPMMAKLGEGFDYVGPDTSVEKFQEHISGSRYAYWRADAEFRRDNPSFSTLHAGNSKICALDLYHWRLPAQILHMAGCEPGIDSTGEGNEFIALLRGLFYAGVESVLIDLWHSQHPDSAEAASFVRSSLRTNSDRSSSVRQAQLKLKEAYPHPCHWASLSLWGKSAAP